MKTILLINPPVLTVDEFQTSLYAEAIPFGLIQIATYFKKQGFNVHLIDMMAYLDQDFEQVFIKENFWRSLEAGDNSIRIKIPVYRLGKSFAFLQSYLESIEQPEKIFVTCTIAFNYPMAFKVINVCKNYFPRVPITIGGNYATLFPSHAKHSHADEVYRGRYKRVDNIAPDIELLDGLPKIWLFRLVHGCKHKCSYCINNTKSIIKLTKPESVVSEIIRIHKVYDINYFSNWDPNVLGDTEIFEKFLDILIANGSPVNIKFEMGLQPDLLTTKLLKKMYKAGVRSLTVPFESCEPSMLRRFGKPYRFEDSISVLQKCKDIGFDTSTFHCTFVVGIRGESLKHVLGTYMGIIKNGGKPTPFPITIIPGTREFKRHREYIIGKDMTELNGHLWPVLDSIERIQEYQVMYSAINQVNINVSQKKIAKLGDNIQKAFSRERELYSL